MFCKRAQEALQRAPRAKGCVFLALFLCKFVVFYSVILFFQQKASFHTFSGHASARNLQCKKHVF